MTNVVKFPSPPTDMETLTEIIQEYTVAEIIVIIKDAETEQVTFILPPDMSIHEVAGRCMDVGMAALMGIGD